MDGRFDELESTHFDGLSYGGVNRAKDYDAIIFTNLPASLFERSVCNDVKDDFESRLRSYDDAVQILYLPNFRRVRADFSSSLAAVAVKQDFHGTYIDGYKVNAFFFQIPSQNTPEKCTLSLPKQEKLFLISPPASPPVGWEQIVESEPVINYDLVHAVLSMNADGGEHELHSGCEIKNIPKIVVHLVSDDLSSNGGPKSLIERTRRPPDKRDTTVV